MAETLYPLTLYYDGACPLCMAEMRNLMLRNERDQRLRFVDIAAPGFETPAGVTKEALARLLHARSASGEWLRGVDTFVAMYEAVGVSWVARSLNWRWLRPLADRWYPWVADHRHLFPRWLAHLVFETAWRRAARRSVSPCADGVCRRDAS
ncbi:thiol-disulfide oxidoreductase DCC family protein [Hydrogenophaga sp. RWCD_12]|uniref:thiol-disulfide oxidoreductase DCC family protein n=1 Tax=Hydrogenophaga sp. RWCD_12 TaxID=3391190 RepID=UPI00398560DA